jgi:hypothetical protein
MLQDKMGERRKWFGSGTKASVEMGHKRKFVAPGCKQYSSGENMLVIKDNIRAAWISWCTCHQAVLPHLPAVP